MNAIVSLTPSVLDRERERFGFKTRPFDHQLVSWLAHRKVRRWAHFWEQRTGKTKLTLDTAAFLYGTAAEPGFKMPTQVAGGQLDRLVDGLLVIAPNGVHRNWATDEAPAHLPDWTNPMTVVYRATRVKTKTFMAEFTELLSHPGLAIFCVNVESLPTENCRQLLKLFLASRRVLGVVDEASDIKTPSGERSKIARAVGKRCAYARILEGTPTTEKPFDVYGQLLFLTEEPLGFSSYTAFQHHFAEFEPAVNHDVARAVMKDPKRLRQHEAINRQRVARGEEPKEPGAFELLKSYRNLDELQRLLKTTSDRVLRSEVRDMPPQTFSKRYFQLTDEQKRVYAKLRDQYRVEFSQVTRVTAPMKITRMMKLQQVACGFLWTDAGASACGDCDGLGLEGEDACPSCDGTGLVVSERQLREIVPPSKDPRLTTLAHEIERIGGEQFIVWGRWRHDLERVYDYLRLHLGLKVVPYWGGLKEEQRDRAKADFQQKRVQGFLGNPQAAGRGLLLPARYVIYYVNGYSLRLRLQSQDRAVTLADTQGTDYCDLVAEGTVDEPTIEALRQKKSVSDYVMSDPSGAFI